MPVTINGGGSITGLSVGGLGSGVVNTATLASGAITSSTLPAGSVLQVKQSISPEVFNYRTNVSLKIFTKRKIKKNTRLKLNDLAFYRSNRQGILHSDLKQVIKMKTKININKSTLLTYDKLT